MDISFFSCSLSYLKKNTSEISMRWREAEKQRSRKGQGRCVFYKAGEYGHWKVQVKMCWGQGCPSVFIFGPERKGGIGKKG